MHNVENLFDDEESTTFKDCDCLPDCNYISYKVNVLQKELKELKSSGNCSEAFMQFHYGDDEYFAYKIHRTFATVELISNVGIILWLFLGISILSILETIYYFTIRLYSNMWFAEVNIK